MTYRTFEEAVADLCGQIGLTGYERDYGQILIDNAQKTATGMYSPTSWLNMSPEISKRLKKLHDIMLQTPEGKEALTSLNLLEGDGVPVPDAHTNYEINPIYLLPSENPELKPTVESLNTALTWRKDMEARIEDRTRRK